MMHAFEISADSDDMLLLTYSPEAIRELAAHLDATERAHGKLSPILTTQVRGKFAPDSERRAGTFKELQKQMLIGAAGAGVEACVPSA